MSIDTAEKPARRPFARWYAEQLPKVGERVFHWEMQCLSIYGEYQEVCRGWGTVLRRHGDPYGLLCTVRFDAPTQGERNPRIVWNHSVVGREPGACCHWPKEGTP